MKFAPKSNRRTGRVKSTYSAAPAQIEQLEVRQLLAAPPTITLPDLGDDGTIADSTPEISLEDMPADAVSFDIWISSLETYSTVQVHTGLAGTSFTPTDPLPMGDVRVWVRANFADDTSTDWTTGFDFRIVDTPSITGPVGEGTRNVVLDNTPTITWDAAPGALRFQVFLRDDTAVQGRQVTLLNTDEELREWTVPDDEALELGEYTAWVRSVDPSGRISEWSDPFKFDVGPTVNILGPDAPAFDSSPILRWEAVDRATEYEVYVIEHDFDTPVTDGSIAPIYRETVTGTSFQIPDELPDGGYAFWVRAVNRTAGNRTVYGGWGSPTQFATLRAPVISVPSAVEDGFPNPITTLAQPTIEWTEVDDAARYELWIDKSNSRPPYLQETTTTNSFTFDSRLPEGKYFIWVRAVSTRGEFSAWSAGYTLEASGGRPVITTPSQGDMVVDTPFEWLGIEGAVSYEIWVDHSGVDYDFINVDGITETSYFHPDPLPLGSFRVWVRALFADGTYSPWSLPVSFETVVELDSADENQESTLLASLSTDVSVEVTPTENPDQRQNSHQSRAVRIDTDSNSAEVMSAVVAQAFAQPEMSQNELVGEESVVEPLPEDLLTQLAQECVDTEWWDLSRKAV